MTTPRKRGNTITPPLEPRTPWRRWRFTKDGAVLSIRTPQDVPMILEEAGWKIDTELTLGGVAIEAEAAGAPLREALDKLQTDLIRSFPVNGSYNRTAIWQAIQRVCGAALTTTPVSSEPKRPRPCRL